jgi:hypothetical protein
VSLRKAVGSHHAGRGIRSVRKALTYLAQFRNTARRATVQRPADVTFASAVLLWQETYPSAGDAATARQCRPLPRAGYGSPGRWSRPG